MCRRRAMLLLCIGAALGGCHPAGPPHKDAAAPPQGTSPPPAALRPSENVEDLRPIDDVVRAAIARRDVPGAVIAVVRHGEIVFEHAYGLRSEQPARQPMTVDTVFDLGSLTKVIATAPAVMLLAQEGRLALGDRVSRYLPELRLHGAHAITIEQLLLHTSGLIADNDLRDYADGADRAIQRVFALTPQVPPGSRFVYSDVGFILLGALVERVSGEPLDVFTRRRLFEPLGMRDTMFRPGPALAARAAPTVPRRERMLRGEVHDPRAHLLGGVAGHAGLFSTAGDLARFAQMMIGRVDRGAGRRQAIRSPERQPGMRIFERTTFDEMTRPRVLPGDAGLRALGWDMNTKFSRHRGALRGGFGHTGYPGTSIWIVPKHGAAVIVLTSRLHPDGRGTAEELRREVADVVARAIGD